MLRKTSHLFIIMSALFCATIAVANASQDKTAPIETKENSYNRSDMYHRLDHFQQEIDKAFQHFFNEFGIGSRPNLFDGQMRTFPRLDISETDNAYHITAEMPGVSKEEILLEYKEGRLIISGEKKSEREEQSDQYHRVERAYGSFRRDIPLPSNIDIATIKAKFDNGLLKITVNKMPGRPEKTKQINIE